MLAPATKGGVMLELHTEQGTLNFLTHPDIFSPNNIDRGTLAMLKHVDFAADDFVLDLGCGYGVVGIWVARKIGADRVVMVDNDGLAVKFARENAQLNRVEAIKTVLSDGFTHLDDTGFSLILSNPPYHAQFEVPKHFIEKGFNRLVLGGKMVMVTKRKDWYKNRLIAVFGGVKIIEEDGYYVFVAEKRSDRYAFKSSRKKK